MIRFSHSFMESFEYKDEYFCKIYDDDVSVGYCKYYKGPLETTSVYIEYIYIYEEYRRKGYATAMVKELQSKYKLLWEYSFTELGRMWYDDLIDKGVVKLSE